MNYYHLIYQLPAILAGTTIAAYLSPVKLPPRFAPLLMFLVGLIVLAVPEVVSMALALTVPAAWLQTIFKIDLHSHEPLKVTIPKVKLRKPKFELRNFITKAYPNPDAPVTEPADDADEEPLSERGEVPIVKSGAGATVSTVPRYVPSL